VNAREARLLLVFFLLPTVLFFHPMLAGKIFMAGDIRFSFHPWLTYAAQNLQAGEFPLWNPYTSCGDSFFANPQNLLFLPTAVLFWIFPFAGAWPLFVVLNQGLLFGAFYLLARRWQKPGPALLAASAAAWSGAVIVLLEFPSVGATLPWAVFFFALSLAGAGPLAALAAALLFFGGYVPFIYYAGMAAGLGVLARAGARRGTALWRGPLTWGAAVGLAFLIWLPQILTSAEAARDSLRAAMSSEEINAFRLTPVFFIKFLIPEIFDKGALPFAASVFDRWLWPLQRNWLNTFFLGAAPFLLALSAFQLRQPQSKNLSALVEIGRRRDGTLLAAAFVLLFGAIALGVGVEPLRAWAPGFRYTSHYANATLVVVFALAFLAGEGLALFRRKNPVFWALWAAVLGLCLAEALWPAAREATLRALLDVAALTDNQHRWVAVKSGGAAAAVAAAGAALLLPDRARAPAVILLTLGALWSFGRNLHPWAEAGFYHATAPLADRTRDIPQRLAFSPETMRRPPMLAGADIIEGYQSDRQTLRPNQNLPFRVPFAWGYELLPQRAFAEFRRAIVLDGPSPPLDFAGGRFLVSISTLPAPYKYVGRRENALLYENPRALPRVTWTPRARTLADTDERLRYLSSDWNPAAETVVEKPFPAGEATAAAEAPSWRESRGRVEALGQGAGWLVYSQQFFPGWEVYVNGTRGDLWRANHAFQAVRTPAGPWRAFFIYRADSFRWGLLGMLAGLTLTGLWLWRTARGKTRGMVAPVSLL